MKVKRKKGLKEEGTNHDASIKKTVLIRKGEIPQLMNFSTSIFKPGQEVDEHSHQTMYEVFQITSGKIDFVISGEKIVLEKGDCVTIEPGEIHSQSNPYQEEAHLTYFGIAID